MRISGVRRSTLRISGSGRDAAFRGAAGGGLGGESRESAGGGLQGL